MVHIVLNCILQLGESNLLDVSNFIMSQFSSVSGTAVMEVQLFNTCRLSTVWYILTFVPGGKIS